MYYTDDRFCSFVSGAGKGVFVDAEFHPMRWHLFNTGEAFYAYFLANQILPRLLDKSGYSEELIAYAHQARIVRNHDYLNFESSLEYTERYAQAAVKAYIRRVEDGQT
ncbi:hypothetical protein CVT25_003362 [Psilocybe cyanescens]|uniref:Uncharacterized protein n=1 Tax=Psilocybe cyanescens TaxID=93625 RepID=A0A409XQY5_PSICY|nr:hypothetical protein CVT25_003362 [Psilocybe cyanescens]